MKKESKIKKIFSLGRKKKDESVINNNDESESDSSRDVIIV